jgi:hypothetical protein
VPTKRATSADLGASRGALHLASAFPRPVWLDHLLPLVTVREAVMLRTSCKAMRTIVAEMRADLGERPVKHLKAMLTCFPQAHTIILYDEQSMTRAEQDNLIVWLEEHGNSLVRVQCEIPSEDGEGMFLRRALRAGVFRKVKSWFLNLNEEDDRDLLIDGIVSGVESIYIDFSGDLLPIERAAVRYLRTFAALKDTTCIMGFEDTALPPFIPPSLEALTLNLYCIKTEPVLLPGGVAPMIKSSGAKLRRLALTFRKLEEEGTARGVRRLLQACAPTLKTVTLVVKSPFESTVEVAEGLAGCQHLEGLTAPISTFAVMPPGAGLTFRLVHLRLGHPPREGRALSSVALWGLMARGGFPTLASLSMESHKWRWGAELGPAMVAAFEGVAGTLKALTLKQSDLNGAVDGAEASDVLRQLGEAIGKLHRLETLELDIGGHGLQYRRIAQGMGEGSCPALRSVATTIEKEAAWLACRPSILLPSVQALRVTFDSEAGAEPVALACALISLGYRGGVVMKNVAGEEGQRDEVRQLLKARLLSVRFE